ncbi:MAG: tRNA lysidine(34) synthetase TilS [Candidatus Marinimicrobia bacterium]|nr:tRNA lysidine(34) synthetase TilS [Candidatus Neomarinimicrobiota bacterium]
MAWLTKLGPSIMQLQSASLLKILLQFPDVTSDSTFLLAVSGGIDSMVMLDLYAHLRRTQNIQFQVAHIDHTIREESATDAEFVMKHCRALNVDCTVEEVDVPAEMQASGESLEMCARRLRYEALESIATDQNLDFICTAHNANDEAETVLMRILSGTGVTGLQGIRHKRDKIIRPLLRYTREQIEAHASRFDVPYRPDKTNDDLSILRNRIRHSLLPLLEEQYNPSVVDALNRLSTAQTEVQELLDDRALRAKSDVVIRQSTQEIMLDIQGLRTYFTAIQKVIIFNCLHELGVGLIQPNFEQTEQLLSMIQSAESGIEMLLPGNIRAVVDRNYLYFTPVNYREKFAEPFQSDAIQILGKYRIVAEMLNNVTGEVLADSNEMIAYFDASALSHRDLIWRNWNSGDLLRLSGGRTKKLSDIWIDQKVPVWDKYLIPLLAAGSEILWVPGYKRSGVGWVTEETDEIYKLTAKRVA